MTGIEQLAGVVTVRTCTVEDAEALLRLHRLGFGAEWSMRDWRWRFVGNPSGRLEVAAAFAATGECVAMFGGVPLPCRYGGEPGDVQCASDVVAHPRLRGNLGGAAVLVRTAELFFARFGGGATRIVYGCPQLPLLRTLVRRVRSEVFGDLMFLVREAGPATAEAPAEVTAAPAAELPPEVDLLWQRCAEQIDTGTDRDRRYLQWRYLQHPRVRYTVVVARAPDAALRGLAVIRDGGLHPEVCSLVEWLVPRRDREAERALLQRVQQLAAADGRRVVMAAFAPGSPEFQWFQADHGFHVRVSPHQMIFRSFAAGIDRRFLFERWFLTMGDIDFL
jgi:hypothetical protein